MHRYASIVGSLLLAGCGGGIEGGPGGDIAFEGDLTGLEFTADTTDLGVLVDRAQHAFSTSEGGLLRYSDPWFVASFKGHALEFWPAGGSNGCDGTGDELPPDASPLVVETLSVRRSVELLDASLPQRDSDGTVVRRSPQVVERITATEEGLEQVFEFARAPLGSGGLEVEVAIAGYRFEGVSEAGLQLRDPVSGVGVTYSHGTWVDAEGTRTAVPADYVGGAIHLVVPAELVDGSAYPAVLDPTITTSDYQAHRAATASEKIRTQREPAIASNITGAGAAVMLLAWTDLRCGLKNPDVRAMRIKASGVFVDPAPFPISYSPDPEEAPSVAYNKATDSFLVVYEKVAGADRGIYLREIPARTTDLDVNYLHDELGSNYRYDPLDGEEKLTAAATSEWDPDIACSNDATANCYVVWSEGAAGKLQKVRGLELTRPGWGLQAEVTILEAEGKSARYPAIAAHFADGYVVAALNETDDEIISTIVNPGPVPDAISDVIVLGAAQSRPDVASLEGTSAPARKSLVVWLDGAGDVAYSMRDGANQMLFEDVLDSTLNVTDTAPSVAFSGPGLVTQYWGVYWHRTDGGGAETFVRQRLKTDGTSSALESLASRCHGGDRTAATAYLDNGGNHKMAWVMPTCNLLYYDDEVIAAKYLPWRTGHDTTPGVAFGGGKFAMVWDQTDASNRVSILATTSTLAGGNLTLPMTGAGSPTLIALGKTREARKTPVIAYDGEDFITFWVDTRRGADSTDLYGRIYDTALNAWMPEFLLEESSRITGVPAIDCDTATKKCVVLFARTLGPYLRAVRWSQAGGKDGPSFTVSNPDVNAFEPAIAWNGVDFVVAWRQNVLLLGRVVDTQIRGARIALNGSVRGLKKLACAAGCGPAEMCHTDGFCYEQSSFTVSAADGYKDSRPSVAALSSTEMLFAWTGYEPLPLDQYDILDRTFDGAAFGALNSTVPVNKGLDQMAPWIEKEPGGTGVGGYRMVYLSNYFAGGNGVGVSLMGLALGTDGQRLLMPGGARHVEEIIRRYAYGGVTQGGRPTLAVKADGSGTGVAAHDAPLDSTCSKRTVVSAIDLLP